jgi:hypothetical protein
MLPSHAGSYGGYGSGWAAVPRPSRGSPATAARARWASPLTSALPARRRGRRKSQSGEKVLYVVIAALVLGVLGLGWGLSSKGSSILELQHQNDSLQREFRNRMNELSVLKVCSADPSG